MARCAGLLLLALLPAGPALAQAERPVQPRSESPFTAALLQSALRRNLTPPDAAELSERVKNWFGNENILKGAPPRIEEMLVAFGIELPEGSVEAPEVISDDGSFRIKLQRIGNTGVFASVRSMPDGTILRVVYTVGAKKLGGGNVEVYAPHPDSLEKPGVPRGEVRKMPKWNSSVFPGTSRDWWIYIPAQYRTEQPAAVMVFQDGQNYVPFVPTVFDNLIAAGDMPVTVGIFIPPGVFSDGRPNRSFEYDTLSDQYARFLLEEMLPEAEKIVNLRKDAAGRAIAGISSGGICAFTVAWERPNEFSKVLSWVGSFTNIASGKTLREGGHNYPALVRKTPKKPIRVFLQGGENDLDNAHGNWPLANQEMAKALAYAGYDYKLVFGRGFHSNRHGRSILPDSLRWLWEIR